MHVLTWYFWASMGLVVAAVIVIAALQLSVQWYWFAVFAAVTVPFSPWISQPQRFLRGGLDDNVKTYSSFFLLSFSTFVSWVMAKSILNASKLGGSFGVVGGVAYASWYTSFFSTAFVVYLMRKQGYRSLPEAINMRFGQAATVTFTLTILYRLVQEVWSNALVVAGFYGEPLTTPWWIAACVSAAIPAIYCITGGMRASLTTDVLQAVVKVAFLAGTLGVIFSAALSPLVSWNPAGTCTLKPGPSYPSTYELCASATGSNVYPNGTLEDPAKAQFAFTPAGCNYTGLSLQLVCSSAGGTWSNASCKAKTDPACEEAGGSWAARPMWSLAGGLDLAIVGLMQGLLSYPFFDPVLTDRAFLAEPHTMAGAFVFGGLLSAAFIFMFSFLGVFGNMQAILDPSSVPDSLYSGMLSGAPQAVAAFFGTAVYQVVTLIFLVSSCAVLDSTFSSTAKVLGPETMGLLQDGRPRPPQCATHRHAMLGRVAIAVIAVVGLLPALSGPAVLDATTVSGTMVIGLGPPIYALIFLRGYRPLVFHLPFWTGVAFGVVYQLATGPTTAAYFNLSGWRLGNGSYSLLLGFNVISTVACWGVGLLALLENPYGRALQRPDGDGAAAQVGLLGRWLGDDGLFQEGGPEHKKHASDGQLQQQQQPAQKLNGKALEELSSDV